MARRRADTRRDGVVVELLVGIRTDRDDDQFVPARSLPGLPHRSGVLNDVGAGDEATGVVVRPQHCIRLGIGFGHGRRSFAVEPRELCRHLDARRLERCNDTRAHVRGESETNIRRQDSRDSSCGHEVALSHAEVRSAV
jgi:hypothetical protein